MLHSDKQFIEGLLSNLDYHSDTEIPFGNQHLNYDESEKLIELVNKFGKSELYISNSYKSYDKKTQKSFRIPSGAYFCSDCNTVRYKKDSIYFITNDRNHQSIFACRKCGMLVSNDNIGYLTQRYVEYPKVWVNDDKVSLTFLVKIPYIHFKKYMELRYQFRVTWNIRTGQTYTFRSKSATKFEIDGRDIWETRIKAPIVNITYTGWNHSFRNVVFRQNDILMELYEAMKKIMDMLHIAHIEYNPIEQNNNFKVDSLFMFNRFPLLQPSQTLQTYVNNKDTRIAGGNLRKVSRLAPFTDLKTMYNLRMKGKQVRKCLQDKIQLLEYVKFLGDVGVSSQGIVTLCQKVFYTSTNLQGLQVQLGIDQKAIDFHTMMISLCGESRWIKKIMNVDTSRKTDLIVDCIQMYGFIHDKECEHMLESVDFTRSFQRIHDELVRIQQRIKGINHPIRWEKGSDDLWLNLEDQIDDYHFFLPENTDRVRDVGIYLDHCIGGYVDQIRNHNTIIMIVSKGNKDNYVMCLELTQHDNMVAMYQTGTYQNRYMIPEFTDILSKWYSRHKNVRDIRFSITTGAGCTYQKYMDMRQERGMKRYNSDETNTEENTIDFF